MKALKWISLFLILFFSLLLIIPATVSTQWGKEKALQLINRKAMALQHRSDGKPNAVRRMNFGIYFFHASDGAPNEAETDDDEDSA